MNRQIRILTGGIEPSFVAATSAWGHGLIDEFSLDADDAYRIDLCLEELVTNTIAYAESEYQGLRFDIRASISPQQIVVDLFDPAQPYDPLAAHKPRQVTQSIDDYQIGGQGITLVKEYSDSCRYEYLDGHNHLELVFNLAQVAKFTDSARHMPRDVDRRKHFGDTTFPLVCADGTVIPEEQRTASDRRVRGFLSRSEVFHDVPYAVLESLIDRFPIQQFAAETVLLKPGDCNDDVLVVLSGRLKVGLGMPGFGEFIDIGVGGCVGEMSVIDNRPVSAHVIAEPNTKLLLVDGTSFIEDLLVLPKVSRNLLSALAERMRRNNELIIKRIRLEAEMEHLQRELAVAREIQESLLPKEPLFSDDPRLDCKGRMCTAKEVGGDFYDVFFLDHDNLFFVIGDVCGKGLPAALFMVRAISALRAQTGGNHLDGGYVAEVVERLNTQLCTYNDKQQFLTAFCGILNLQTGNIQYLNAGHNPPTLAQGNGEFIYLEEPINPIIGMIEGMAYRSGTVTLTPGGMLLLYTDGVTEAEMHDTKMYGEDRLLQCLNTYPTRSAAGLVSEVFASVQEFVAGAPQSDDITVLAIGRH
ncbi:MAG: SpoIIE family protein phosphatase [Sulfuritalea sp.]|nr:SpoIIE family protein phosphatase [Sulfuritalea sp.]